MTASLELAYAHCAQVARREAKNFYYGFLLLPPRQRRAIYAAYAFARLCDDIVDEEGDEAEKASRLAQVRRDLERCLAGQPEGPVFTALHHAVNAFSIPPEYLFRLVDGVEMDLHQRRYETFRDLERYCYLVASVVGLICIEVFGYRGAEEARRRAADLGIALQLTNILRDVQEDLGRDRIYIPQEEMAAFGYSEEALRRGETGPAFRRLMAFQVERAREYYRSGLRLLPLLPRRPRACVGAMAGIYLNILERIARRPEAVLQERVSLGTGAKLALAGRELVRSVVPL